MDRRVGYTEGTGNAPDTGPGFWRKFIDLVPQFLRRYFFRTAALVFPVRDVPTGTAGIGGLQKPLPDPFAGLGGHPEGPRGLQEGALAEFGGAIIVGIVLVLVFDFVFAGSVFQE